MKDKIGLSADELEQIFAQIKQKSNAENLDGKIYEAYLKLVDVYASKFQIKKEQVQDLYNDVFSYIYNNVLSGVIQPVNFGITFENVLAKQCVKLKSNTNNFKSELLGNAYAKSMAIRKEEEQRQAKEYATQSLLYVINVLDEIAADPDLMERYGLSEQKICVIKDYYALNAEHKRYNVVELAQKYNISESRAKALIVSGVKVIREMQDFDQIKAQLR